MLLIEDDALIDGIDQFIVKLDQLYRITNEGSDKVKANKIYAELNQEAGQPEAYAGAGDFD